MTKKSIVIIFVIALLMLLAYLEYRGYFWHNEVFANKYKIKGLDVSNHQGNIHWNSVKEEKRYRFVFIKATEGNDFQDKYFDRNWNEAKKNNILRGAYHFFTTGSTGKEQAVNFISVVPREKGTLPPVIDIEVYGRSKESYQKELRDLIQCVEEYYEQKPILYVMYPYYEAYIKGNFNNYSIWIRDIAKYPKLSDKREWTFWQYSNRGHVRGIDSYVDLNCFNGSLSDLLELVN